MARPEGQIRKRGEGRYQIICFDGYDQNGVRRYKAETVGGTLKEANRRKREILRSRDHGEYVEPSKETLDQYLDRWLQSVAQRLAGRTLEDYRWALKKYICPRIGRRRLQKLTPLDIQGVVDDLGTLVGPRTVRLAIAPLGAALKQAVKWGKLSRNPASYIDLPKTKRPDHVAFDLDELERFRAEAGVSRAPDPIGGQRGPT